MGETVLLPSPNWFQVSGTVVTNDEWLIYGGPSKSLCILEPFPSDYEPVVDQKGYQTHYLHHAHPEKIVSVDVNPEWPVKKTILTGSADGLVKQWSLHYENNKLIIKFTHSHDVHSKEKETTAGVGYSSDSFAITVGVFGSLVKWDVSTNIVKTYQLLKGFKPVSMSCSQHLPLHVAVGTKQGVVFLIDLNGAGKIVYKIRGHDEEITQLSWCPQYEVQIKKKLKDALGSRLDKIRNEAEQNDDSGISTNSQTPEKSHITNNSIEDNSEVVEDDLFDMYKDHEDDEFGHKKYQPEEVYVKVPKEENKVVDFLAECLKLKGDILKRKNEVEPSIESLVDAIDKTHIEITNEEKIENVEKATKAEPCAVVDTASSIHIHRHLLVTIGKQGGVKVWSKSGKLVASCVVNNGNFGVNKKPYQQKTTGWMTVLWYRADTLLISDGKSQLLECNPLFIDCKSKLEWRVVHSLHKRGLFCICSSAGRVQETPTARPVWTAAQDRNIIKYSIEERKVMATYATTGGYIYAVEPCPYNAGKIAVAVGDGAVRVWETEAGVGDVEWRLSAGRVASYWQNVQGKVLNVAWHPTRENLLAFSTAEARVGLIDTGGKSEKPAKVLNSSLTGAVYGLCWGDDNTLYACGGGSLYSYNIDKLDNASGGGGGSVGAAVPVVFEGLAWSVVEVRWSARALLVGAQDGAVAALDPRPPHRPRAVCYHFNKLIHNICVHPEQVSTSSEPSPYRHLVAVSSLDKSNNIALLSLGDDDNSEVSLSVWKTLSGHKATVMQLAWNPHVEGMLLSTSQDMTIRVWAVGSGGAVAVCGAGAGAALGGGWAGWPACRALLLAGGADCVLRLWRTDQHPAEAYVEPKQQPKTKSKKEKVKVKDEVAAPSREELTSESEDQQAVTASDVKKTKASKKFLLPLIHKQMTSKSFNGCRKMLNKLKLQNGLIENGNSEGTEESDIDTDFIKLFGNMNEVNEILDKEQERHLSMNQLESYAMLSIFRGQIDTLFQVAAQKDFICPFLLSIAPTVSAKYWKDAASMYLAQMERMAAKGEESKQIEGGCRGYGGSAYRRAALRLALHDARAAAAALRHHRLYKEAYVLCRVRYMDTIAEEVLKEWAEHSYISGMLNVAAVCHLALGEVSEAARVLARGEDEAALALAADAAAAAGRHTYARHIQDHREQIRDNKIAQPDDLEALPTRMELLMKNDNDNELESQ